MCSFVLSWAFTSAFKISCSLFDIAFKMWKYENVEMNQFGNFVLDLIQHLKFFLLVPCSIFIIPFCILPPKFF